MPESQTRLISYAEIFRIAATHFYGDPPLVEFIPDENKENEPPEMLRKKSQVARIQLSLLRSKHAAIMRLLASVIDVEARTDLEKRRDELQAEISATLKNWIPDAFLRDYADKFGARRNAMIVDKKIRNACSEGKITLRLNSDAKLPPRILSYNSAAQFLSKESILECEIDGEMRSGIVYGDEKEIKDWLIGEDIAACIYDTPEKRKRACAAFYEARILNPETCKFTKAKQFVAISEQIPGLQQKEFDSVHRTLGRKYEHIRRGGRPKTRPETDVSPVWSRI